MLLHDGSQHMMLLLPLLLLSGLEVQPALPLQDGGRRRRRRERAAAAGVAGADGQGCHSTVYREREKKKIMLPLFGVAGRL